MRYDPLHQKKLSVIELIAIFPLLNVLIGVATKIYAPDVWVYSTIVTCALLFYGILLSIEQMASIFYVTRPLIILCAAYIIGNTINFGNQGVKNTVSIISCALIVIYYLRYGKIILSSFLFLRAAKILLLAITFLALFGLNEKNFDTGVAFYAGAFLCYLHIFCRRGGAFFLVILFFGAMIGLAVYSNFRMLIFLSAFSMLIYVALLKLSFGSRGIKIIYTIILILMAMFFMFYVKLEENPYLVDLNNFAYERTGRLLQSGRDKIWPDLYDLIQERIFFGFGVDALPSEYIDTNLSAHNYYLQLMLQMGFFGLILALWFIFNMWMLVANIASRNLGNAFAAGVFSSFIVHNLTEVLMFQNALPIAFLEWTFVSVVIGLSYRGFDAKI